MATEEIIRYTAISVAAAAFFYFFFLRRLCVDTVPRNMQIYTALHSPTVRGARNALERRIALALREAGGTFRECTICAFANTTKAASASCALCGTALPLPPERGLRRLVHSNARARDDHVEVAVESSRLRRVRRRREWTRREQDGEIKWRHQEECETFGPYVLQSSTMRTSTPTLDLEIAQSGSKLSNDEGTDHVAVTVGAVAVSELARQLDARLRGTTISLVDACTADPTQLAFSSSEVTVSNGIDLAFPTKLVNFMTSAAGLFAQANEELTPSIEHFHIAREDLWRDSVEAIAAMTPDAARRPIRVEFVGEPGIDAGALYREWVGLLNKTLTSPEAGIFSCVDAHEQTFYLNPMSREVLGDNHLVFFLVAGRLIGRALLDGNPTGFQLAPPLLKIMLGYPVGFNDLEFFDAEVFKSLRWLLDNDGVEALGLDFTVVEKFPTGETREVELVTGGRAIDVTDANKCEYVDRKLQYLLFESVREQLFAFLTGFYEVVPGQLLMEFDGEELGLLLSGSDEIDVDDWEAHTIAFADDGVGDRRKPLSLLPCYHNFWKVIRELSNEERRRFLHFATGSTRPPPGGFSALTSYDGKLALFTLRGVPEVVTHGYLQSHACFNRVDLPQYWTLKPMRDAIHAAISIQEDGFTIA